MLAFISASSSRFFLGFVFYTVFAFLFLFLLVYCFLYRSTELIFELFKFVFIDGKKSMGTATIAL